ncbi:hypothetical protein GCM10029964_113950 [Kibdelosporangium lantanae]
MSDEGRLVAGRYRLMHRIGTGAMGVVWQARDERLNRVVAIKQVLLQTGLSADEIDEALERVQREGRIAAKLHHPNAVTVFDVVDDDDAPWLVMEYVPNQSLAAAMKERGALPRLRSPRSARRSPPRWPPRTPPGSCTGTSSPATSCWPTTAP